jgi:hypothetical protein
MKQSMPQQSTKGTKTKQAFFVFLCLIVALIIPTLAQRPFDDFGNFRQRRRPTSTNEPAGKSYGEYTFVRTIYDSPQRGYGRRGYGYGGGTWTTDYPEADNNFIVGLREWAGTNLKIAPRPEALEIMDDRIFDYPILYAVEPGFMDLSTEQAARLHEYLNRGGFLFFDDFWGEYEWDNVREQFRKIDPEYEIKDLPLSHPIFHSYFDVEEVVQVPNVYNAQRGITSEKGGIVPHYAGIENKNGRVIAFISGNCDMGDAWEWINDPVYPAKYGLPAYKVGINVVIYAMSH